MTGDRELLRVVRAIATGAGMGTVASLQPIEGGGNNRAYRAVTGSRDLFVKQYFRSADDPRDRFTAETAFARFAWQRGVRAIAEPLGHDAGAGVAAFAWVEGRRIVASEVTSRHVGAALDFMENLNRHRADPQAGALGSASEACFTIGEHLRLVTARIDRLTEQAAEPARTFARERLQPAWVSLRARVHTGARELGLDLDRAVPLTERCVSPSDFGFHNALVSESGGIVFHDFEYAGWDDPAKLVGDFFSQVAVPVGPEHEELFGERVARMLGLSDLARTRIGLLGPVFRMKWCCIVLNEFLPAALRRRAFAAGEAPASERMAAQLDKAEAALDAAKAGR
jgi:hypothetical protein